MSANALRKAVIFHDRRLLLLRNALANSYFNPDPSPPPCTPPPLGPKRSCYDHGHNGCNPVGGNSRGYIPVQDPDRNSLRLPYIVNPARQRRSEVMSTSRRINPSFMVNNDAIWKMCIEQNALHCILSSNELSQRVTSRLLVCEGLESKQMVSYFSKERGEDISQPDQEVSNRPTPAQLSFAFLKLREEVNYYSC